MPDFYNPSEIFLETAAEIDEKEGETVEKLDAFILEKVKF